MKILFLSSGKLEEKIVEKYTQGLIAVAGHQVIPETKTTGLVKTASFISVKMLGEHVFKGKTGGDEAYASPAVDELFSMVY